MQYYPLSLKKHHFIITPSELRQLLADFHHVIVTKGVDKNYRESNPDEFFSIYELLYHKLKEGEKLVWKNDYDIAGFTIGVTHHLENCQYSTSTHLLVPNFLEPCPCIDTFCFTPWKNQISTSFAVHQFPENICGLCLYFPTKIEYAVANWKHTQGVVSNTDLDDFKSYEILLSNIKRITKPLRLEFNDQVYRTTVRISNEAKKDIGNFYFIVSNDITIL